MQAGEHGVRCIDEEEEGEERPEGDQDAGGARNCREYVGKKKTWRIQQKFVQVDVADVTKFVKIDVSDAVQFVTSARRVKQHSRTRTRGNSETCESQGGQFVGGSRREDVEAARDNECRDEHAPEQQLRASAKGEDVNAVDAVPRSAKKAW